MRVTGLIRNCFGRTIGVLGGSFDPPHMGHVHITKEALKRFDLDEIWWMVSPSNPLKPHGPAPMAKRMAAAAAIMDHPRVRICDFEARAGTRYTAQTIRALQNRYGNARFVWLMGADNLAAFDQWQDWRWIMENVPIGVLARPGQRISARMSKAATIYERYRLRPRQGPALALMAPPAWCFVNVPMMQISSTQLRQDGHWRNT